MCFVYLSKDFKTTRVDCPLNLLAFIFKSMVDDLAVCDRASESLYWARGKLGIAGPL